jgi:hypothetical protein
MSGQGLPHGTVPYITSISADPSPRKRPAKMLSTRWRDRFVFMVSTFSVTYGPGRLRIGLSHLA